jgi:hypothetical protein
MREIQIPAASYAVGPIVASLLLLGGCGGGGTIETLVVFDFNSRPKRGRVPC